MTYNPGIPAINTRIDQTYNLITTNFTQLNNIFGGTGAVPNNKDHYAWDYITVGQRGLHQKVTLPGLAGDPVTLASSGIIYSKLVSGVPQLYYEYDTGRKVQLSCVNAWCRFSGTAAAPIAITDGFNVTNITRPVATGTYQINFTNALANANYAVLVSLGPDTSVTLITDVASTAVGNCVIESRRTTNNSLFNANQVNVLVIGN